MAELPIIQNIPAGEWVEVADAAALGEVVRRCAHDGQPIVDYGAYHAGLGHAPPHDYVAIRKAAGVIEHYISDMTVKVRAATPIRDLQAALAEQNQWLPIDGVNVETTVGETIAHHGYGPLCVGFGTMREIMLGLSYVDVEGRAIAVGGRTVKNVAGYDVTRFMVGSLNMLGLVTEATLRTWAIPEQATRVSLPYYEASKLQQHLTYLLTHDAAPQYLHWQQAPDSPPTAHVGYLASSRECGSRFAALREWLPSVGYDPRADGAERKDGTLADDEAARQQQRDWRDTASAVVKLIVAPRDWAEVAEAVTEAALPKGTWIDALPTRGVVYVGGDWSVEQALALDARLTHLAEYRNGLRVWLARPDHTEKLAPVEPMPAEWPMVQRLKQALDPIDLFNPGRIDH